MDKRIFYATINWIPQRNDYFVGNLPIFNHENIIIYDSFFGFDTYENSPEEDY